MRQFLRLRAGEVCSLLYDVKKKKKERGSATFPAALFTVLRKKWERGSLERCFRAHRLFRENFQRNALNLLIRTEREREKKNEKIHVGVEFIG